MTSILGILNGQSNKFNNLVGLNGFLNGKSLGWQNQNDDVSTSGNNLMAAVGKSLGLNLNPQKTSANSLANTLQNLQKSDKTNKTSEDVEKNKDRYDASADDENSLSQILQQAVKNGASQQIVVSEDGRFEASIDMKLNSDGSYSLDMSIHFANARAAMMAQQSSSTASNKETAQTGASLLTGGAETGDNASVAKVGEDAGDSQGNPGSLNYQGADALYQSYTSYEQLLQARGFQASIFYEQAKTVAASAERAYGSDMGNQYMSVAGGVAQEYTLNISISGDDLSNFNDVAQQLTQFDDSGTLSGFLSAAQNMLNTDSSNLGSFVDAAQSLIGATQQHVSTKLSNFFTDMQNQFGGTLEEMGFDSNFLSNLGQDVQTDLNNFFQVTNNLFDNLYNSNQLENTQDPETQLLETMTEQMEQQQEQQQVEQEQEQQQTTQDQEVQEQQEEPASQSLLTKPDREPIFKNELPPRIEPGTLFKNHLFDDTYNNSNQGVLEAVA